MPMLVRLALSLLVLSGCADVTRTVREDLAVLRQDLNSLTLTVHGSRSDTEAVLGQIDRRTREQVVETEKQIASLQARTDTLNTELGRLGNRVEELHQRLESLTRQAARPPRTPSPPAQPPSKPSAALQASDFYQQAYIDFSKGNYQLAISGFQEFLRRYPESDLADNAQYWIGEAHFSLARTYATQGQEEKALKALGQAVQEFRKVIVNHPRGDKVPTALYKEALTLLELKQQSLAQARLQYLLDYFPQSEEAPLARERLGSLKESSGR